MEGPLFRLPKVRKYNYTPRYYDPVKEEFEQRVKQAEAKSSGRGHLVDFKRSMRLKDQWREAQGDRQFFAKVQHQKMMSRIRFLIIVNVLLILVIFAAYRLL